MRPNQSRTRAKVSSLREHLGYHLRMVSNAVSLSFARRLEAEGVTVAEWVILREMYSRNTNVYASQVAEMTGLTRGAVSKLIDRLRQKGLVNLGVAGEDRRYQDLQLTAAASRLVPKLARLADDNDEAFFGALTSSERRQLQQILEKIQLLHGLKTNPIE